MTFSSVKRVTAGLVSLMCLGLGTSCASNTENLSSSPAVSSSSSAISSSDENIPLIMFDTPVNVINGPEVSETESVDPALLWTVVGGNFDTSTPVGAFDAKTPEWDTQRLYVPTSVLSVDNVHVAYDFGFYFIPVYEKDGDKSVVTDIKIYDADGRRYIGDSNDDILDKLVASETSHLASYACSATLLDKDTSISTLEPGSWYAVTNLDGISIANDTDRCIEITSSYYIPDEDEWNRAIYFRSSTDFPDSVASKLIKPASYMGNGYSRLPVYWSFNFVEDEVSLIEKLIHEKECLPLSEVGTTDYRVQEDFIYNDTSEAVELSYTFDEKTYTTVIQPGAFMHYNDGYKKLHRVS